MQSPMRKLKYHVAVSLDGFIARADGSSDCFNAMPQEEHAWDYVMSLALDYDTVLMGRSTYEIGTKVGVTDPYPGLETYVFSTSLKESPNPRVHLARDVVGTVRELKARAGKSYDLSTAFQGVQMQIPKALYLCGGGQLARPLFAEGLIDEVIVKVNPVLLGAGLPLAPSLGRDVRLELLSTKAYGNGVVLLRYAVKR